MMGYGNRIKSRSIGHWVAMLGRSTRFLDAFLPPLCLSCAVPISGQAGLCPSCYRDIGFIHPPICPLCGRRVSRVSRVSRGSSCLGCRSAKNPVTRYRTVFDYDAASRGLVLAFKYGDRLDAAPVYGQWMANFGADVVAKADIIVPVPLHWLRLWRRRYNQAAVLAQHIGHYAGKPVCVDLLIRCRATQPQVGMSGRQRRLNVKGAFVIRPRCRRLLVGQNILLVDDVLTSGATVTACADILKNAGAQAVDVLTLADARTPALSPGRSLD